VLVCGEKLGNPFSWLATDLKSKPIPEKTPVFRQALHFKSIFSVAIEKLSFKKNNSATKISFYLL